MQVVVAHCVSFSRFEQTKKNLVIVAQAVVTAFVLESAVVARGHAWWCLIILAMIMVATFERNAKKDGHTGVPLKVLSFVFALKCLFVTVSKKMVAVVLMVSGIISCNVYRHPQAFHALLLTTLLLVCTETESKAGC